MICKIGNARKKPAKERSKSAKKRRRYESAKLARKNGKYAHRTGSGCVKFEKMKMGFYSVHLGS